MAVEAVLKAGSSAAKEIEAPACPRSARQRDRPRRRDREPRATYS